jgi:hypothetical protein
MHFLVIDDRFRVPIFVFLEVDPRGSSAGPAGVVRTVSLEFAAGPVDGLQRRGADSVRAQATIGQDPAQPDRYVEFASDRHVRVAGFTLIEPRYVGPSWETYVNVFRPEGEKSFKMPPARPGRKRSVAGSAALGTGLARPGAYSVPASPGADSEGA